uniref:Uncharacterized protein n=1 Tax=Romanomermis culicivorax TaxID=13658 RepID=A0A915JB53_ROMCU
MESLHRLQPSASKKFSYDTYGSADQYQSHAAVGHVTGAHSALDTNTKTSASKQCLSIQQSNSGETSIPGLQKKMLWRKFCLKSCSCGNFLTFKSKIHLSTNTTSFCNNFESFLGQNNRTKLSSAISLEHKACVKLSIDLKKYRI